MELSDEMLKIIDLIKAGEVDLVEQLLEGNPELHIDITNDELTNIYLSIWPEYTPLNKWFIEIDNIMHTSKIWLIHWADFNNDDGHD